MMVKKKLLSEVMLFSGKQMKRLICIWSSNQWCWSIDVKAAIEKLQDDRFRVEALPHWPLYPTHLGQYIFEDNLGEDK